MPWPVYSERFIFTTTVGTWVDYTVPAGRRCVITSMALRGNGAAVGHFELRINAVPIYMVDIPAAERSRFVTLRVVAYAGETVGAFQSVTPGAVAVFGYLFSSQTTLRDYRARVDEGVDPDTKPVPDELGHGSAAGRRDLDAVV